MKTELHILVIVAITHIDMASFAVGATDREILSGAVCQPLEPGDHENLRYL
jgi:hypothetical protein